ncbi:MAG: cysteine desulfurase-like protein [Planctomycetaceae bacterium]|nr:cysteine desulfurase-like protein [Planctomycetaceae bacterium]
MPTWDINAIRALFPALQRTHQERPVVYLDGPAGSQVPVSVADAVSHYLLSTNSNRGAASATAIASDAVLEAAHKTFADFLGAEDPASIYFGANMTSLTMACSRALAKQWGPGDEIIVSRLDHDANVTPWVLAATERGATVRHIDLHPEDWTLNQQDFRSKLNERTKLVAIGYASNATGTINPVGRMIEQARSAGALTFIDAVHYAPHGRLNAGELNCDFLACSAYKFFGPHVGIMYGRPELLESIRPFKLRPSTDALPGKWMTGTQCHEGIAGAAAAVQYLASLSQLPESTSLGERLDAAFAWIGTHESALTAAFLDGLKEIPELQIHGIVQANQLTDRAPTFSVTHRSQSPAQLAAGLAEQGVYAWAGNHYALPFTEAAGLEPGGTLRLGALHYNTVDEVHRSLECLRQLV